MDEEELGDAAVFAGRNAVAMGDSGTLAGVNDELRRLLPPEAQDEAERKSGGVN